MWVIVILAGMLNSGGGLEEGYTEMNDLHFQFQSREECEAARPAIEEFVVDGMKVKFGAENVIATSACWTKPQTPA